MDNVTRVVVDDARGALWMLWRQFYSNYPNEMFQYIRRCLLPGVNCADVRLFLLLYPFEPFLFHYYESKPSLFQHQENFVGLYYTGLDVVESTGVAVTYFTHDYQQQDNRLLFFVFDGAGLNLTMAASVTTVQNGVTDGVAASAGGRG
jgi:hypothetical protein